MSDRTFPISKGYREAGCHELNQCSGCRFLCGQAEQEIEDCHAVIKQQDAKIAELEAVQAALAKIARCNFYTAHPDISNTLPVYDTSAAISQARRECGIKEPK